MPISIWKTTRNTDTAILNRLRNYGRGIGSPLRLLDCFGFVTPSGVFDILAEAFAVVDLRFGAALADGGSFADWATGEERKAEGDGTAAESMVGHSYVDTLALAIK